MKKKSAFFTVILVFLSLDQLTKYFVVKNIAHFGSVDVIPGFFKIIHIHNKGAIFGFFSHSNSSLVLFLLKASSLVALGFVLYYFLKAPISDRFMNFSLALILAGALGNQVDRFSRGFVVDFLDFSFWGWHWPTFNVADMCISTGAVLLAFIFFFKRGPQCSPSL
jgi:signal peptidase II